MNGSREDERAERVEALLEDNIQDELDTQNAIRDLGMSPDAIESLAQMVSASVLHAFAVDWSPRWFSPGAIHSWVLRTGEAFARCPSCLIDSPPQVDRDTAKAWVRDHAAVHNR